MSKYEQILNNTIECNFENVIIKLIYEDELKNYLIKKSEETLFVLTNKVETRIMY